MGNNIKFNVPEDVSTRMRINVPSEHELIFCCRASLHPDDYYLYLAFCQYIGLDDRKRETYVTWLYNDSTHSYNQGHYDMSFFEAWKDIKERMWIPA